MLPNLSLSDLDSSSRKTAPFHQGEYFQEPPVSELLEGEIPPGTPLSGAAANEGERLGKEEKVGRSVARAFFIMSHDTSPLLSDRSYLDSLHHPLL